MDLCNILINVQRDAFPELIKEHILIDYKPIRNEYFNCEKISKKFYICVDKPLSIAPVSVLKGGIAHELCHISQEIGLSEYSSSRDGKLYTSFFRYRVLDERNTDLETILRGYGNELLSFLEYKQKIGITYRKDEGLSLKEVRKLMNLNGSKRHK